LLEADDSLTVWRGSDNSDRFVIVSRRVTREKLTQLAAKLFAGNDVNKEVVGEDKII